MHRFNDTSQLLRAGSANLHATALFGPVFGAFCLALSVAGYTTVFVFHEVTAPRSVRLCAGVSLSLFLLGSVLSFPPLWLAFILGGAAILAISTAIGTSRLTLAFHGLIYLFAAASVSGLPQYAAHAVAGAFPPPPSPITWTIAASIILCYAIGGQIEERNWKPQLFHTLSAALAVASAAAILISVFVWLAAGVLPPRAPQVAVIRTLTTCALAVALSWLGPRWQRVELVWLAYATLPAVAAKFLFEDLRQAHPEFIAVSIFLFALTLILVPQIVRKANAKWCPSPTLKPHTSRLVSS